MQATDEIFLMTKISDSGYLVCKYIPKHIFRVESVDESVINHTIQVYCHKAWHADHAVHAQVRLWQNCALPPAPAHWMGWSPLKVAL